MSAQAHEVLSTIIPQVKSYQTDLERQTLCWSVVSVVGKVSNQDMKSQLLSAISDTQHKFEELSEHLIERVVRRYVDKLSVDLKLRSQAYINILNLNLFERTADVGFLATDHKIVDFLAKAQFDTEVTAEVEAYLGEYVKKYSVYRDIVLLTPDLKVVARLDRSYTMEYSTSTIIQDAITHDGFIESDEQIDVMPTEGLPLSYIHRIRSDESGSVVGILAMSFKMDDELARIYETLSSKNSNFQFSLIRNGNEQMYRSPGYLKENIQLDHTDSLEYLEVGKRGYFAYSTKASGYQGFYGLPWSSIASIDQQTSMNQINNAEDTHPQLDENSSLFPNELNELNLEISTALLIVILNGKIQSLKNRARAFLPVLDSFQDIGHEMRQTFSHSIKHIHQIAYLTIETETAFLSKIAMDIMDRNLYERANDCRWWALNDRFREMLSSGKALSNDEQIEMASILSYINDLYTVYTNLFIYDRKGVIVAVSKGDEQALIGTSINDREDIHAALATTTTQQYAVSEFEPTGLYNNEATYIYHAAVRHTDDISQTVGGVAVVFDSTPEFNAILTDFLPKDADGNPLKGSFSLFMDPDRRIISVTDNAYDLKIGDTLDLGVNVFMQPEKNGSTTATIKAQDFLVGYQVSVGYREYKTEDNYVNPLACLVFCQS